MTIHDHKGCLIHYFPSMSDFLPRVRPDAVVAACRKHGGSWRQEMNHILQTPGYDRYGPGKSWYGNLTHQEAWAKADAGVSLPPEVLEIRDQIAGQVKPTLAEAFAWDVAGGMVDVGAYLSGEPECMMTTREEVTRGRKAITIIFNASVHCGISAAVLQLRGLAMLAMVDALEATQKYRVNLYYASGSGRYGNEPGGAAVIRLLDPSHRYDPQAIGFALGSTAMFRRLIFSHWNVNTDEEARRYGMLGDPGYGVPATLRSLPYEIEDTEARSNTALNYSFQGMGDVFNLAGAIRWVQQQLGIVGEVRAQTPEDALC